MTSVDVELVQPILVSTAGSHEATVVAAARAAVELLLADVDNDPCWGEWLTMMFAKTVRRVKPTRLERIIAEVSDPVSVVRLDDAVAVAFRPMTLPTFPAEVARAQVSGTDFVRSGWDTVGVSTVSAWNEGSNFPLLVLNPDLDATMTTGKQAAQAAHALMGLVLTGADVDPLLVQIRVAESRECFTVACDRARTVIQDAGRTEIEPGSVTFAAL